MKRDEKQMRGWGQGLSLATQQNCQQLDDRISLFKACVARPAHLSSLLRSRSRVSKTVLKHIKLPSINLSACYETMRGWFDAFRTDGGPTLYAYSNRTSVTGDVSIITVCLAFLTIYIAFVIIFPGVRREKFSTFCTVTLSLLTGVIICACNFGSDWMVSKGEIVSSYRAFSSHKIKATLGISIGLDHANVTLKVIPDDNRTLDIDFNERLYWNTPSDMGNNYKNALQKGLPYPILTAAEYLTIDKEGCSWGRSYRSAGYYANIALWTAFAFWVLANIMLLTVPRYGAYMMMMTGSLMLLSTLLYWCLKPQTPLEIRFEETLLTFKFGWCFWTTLIFGAVLTMSGLIISIVDWIHPNKFSTFLEIDFDTPYDRHIIIENMHDTRKKRFKIPRLEEPLQVGSRLLRRLSKRIKDPNEEDVTIHPGVHNPAFEMETTNGSVGSIKRPWKSSLVLRSDSKKSNKSFIFKAKTQADKPNNEEILHRSLKRTDKLPQVENNVNMINVISIEAEPSEIRIPEIKRQDSSSSCVSSSSSFGLGILSPDTNSLRSPVESQLSMENTHEPVNRNNSGNIIVFHKADSRGQLHKLAGEVVEIQTDDSAADW